MRAEMGAGLIHKTVSFFSVRPHNKIKVIYDFGMILKIFVSHQGLNGFKLMTTSETRGFNLFSRRTYDELVYRWDSCNQRIAAIGPGGTEEGSSNGKKPEVNIE